MDEVGNRARLQVGGVRACFGFSVISTNFLFSFFVFSFSGWRIFATWRVFKRI